jgi:hypothetical protein
VNTKEEAILKWLGKYRVEVFFSCFIILAYSLFHFTIFAYSGKVMDEYDALHLAGRIDTIPSYSRGFPRVLLSSGENVLIHVPVAGQEYIQAGDSLVKESGSEDITTYRQFPMFTEVSVFGDSASDDVGLIKRYRLH